MEAALEALKKEDDMEDNLPNLEVTVNFSP